MIKKYITLLALAFSLTLGTVKNTHASLLQMGLGSAGAGLAYSQVKQLSEESEKLHQALFELVKAQKLEDFKMLDEDLSEKEKTLSKEKSFLLRRLEANTRTRLKAISQQRMVWYTLLTLSSALGANGLWKNNQGKRPKQRAS